MKLKQLFAAALMLVSAGAWAQTDVTSTYLTNADFSQGTPVTVGVCTYAKDKSDNGTTYANLVDVDGWTAVDSKDGKAGGLFAIGGGAWLGGKGFTAPATDSDGNTGVNVLGIVTCWGASVQYTQDLKKALPAGTYTLILAAYNSGAGQNDVKANLIGFVESNNTTHYATTKKYSSNTWKYEFITFTLTEETTGTISIGYTGEGSSNGLPHLFVSGLQLFSGEVDAEAYEAAKTAAREAKEAKVLWDNAKAAAATALANDEYANVTGSEKTALETEVSKDEPTTTAGYNEATTALETATATFKAAKAAYDSYEEFRAIAVAFGVTPGAAPGSAAEALAATRSYNVAVYTATTADNIFDVTAVYNPSWSDMGTSSGQHWSGDTSKSYADNWSGNTNTTERTATITLPAGSYILMSAGRGSANTITTMSANGTTVTFASNGDMGLGINKAGAASFDAEDAAGFANKKDAAENTGTGWEWRYIPVSLTEETAVTVTQTLTRLSGGAWGSFSDFRILKKGVVAGDDDYTALNAAIASAEGKTLGFEDGQYAPYNNVAALEALAAAKAFDQTAKNEKETVEAVTASLTSATWTANDGEVDAIFDGLFATTAANTTSGDINLPGWTKIQGIRLLVKDETVDPGLAYTDGKAAVFSWGGTTLTYGEQEGYTLPLNKYSIYKLAFKASAWRDGDAPDWVSVELDGVKQEGATSVSGKINDAEGNPFRTYTYYLEPTADNSILKIYMNHHFTLADLSLKLAVAEDITISENADYTPAKNYANVTLARAIKADVWNTFVVPFDLSNDELKTAFGDEVAVAEFSDEADGENVQVNFNKMETPAITANKPVLLKGNAGSSFTFNGKVIKEGEAKVAGTYVDFVGSYAAATAVEAGDYFISANKLYKSVGKTTLKGTHAYIDATEDATVKMFINDLETAIDVVNTDAPQNGAIYNLAGQRVSRAQKGIYIVNGKKVLF